MKREPGNYIMFGGSMKEIKVAKEIITEEIKRFGFNVIKIILFGSRARGGFKEDSDWDLLVVVDKDIQPQQKRRITGEIYRHLAKLEDSYELIIISQSNFEKRKYLIGCISYEADKEGVIV